MSEEHSELTVQSPSQSASSHSYKQEIKALALVWPEPLLKVHWWMLLKRLWWGSELCKSSSPSGDLWDLSQTGYDLSHRSSQDKSLKSSGSVCVAADSEGFQLSAVFCELTNPFQDSVVEVLVHNKFIFDGKELAVVTQLNKICQATWIFKKILLACHGWNIDVSFFCFLSLCSIVVPGVGHKYREFYSQITKARAISAEKKLLFCCLDLGGRTKL